MSTSEKKSKQGSSQERRRRKRTAKGFYPRRGDVRAEGLTKKEILEKYGPKVKMIAERISLNVPPSVDIDDLVSVGLIGLMDAADKYDPSRGYQFKTYSEFRIRGAILDELRAMDWIPRSARDRVKQMEKAYQILLNSLGRKPTDEEVSEEMGITLEKYQTLRNDLSQANHFNYEDIEEMASDENRVLTDTLSSWQSNTTPKPEEDFDRARAKERLHNLLADLPKKERLILSFYYFRGLNNSEISHIMKLSPSRVGQLHTQAIIRLKKKIMGYHPAETEKVVNLFSMLLAA